MNAFTDAYRRLQWAQANPPSQEKLDKIEKARADEALRLKIERLRKNVA